MFRTVRRAAVTVSAAVLCACGGSGSGTSSRAGSSLPADAATVSAIDHAYAAFFGSKSTLAQSQAVLQHGDKFTKTLAKEGTSSYAQNSSAKIDSVQLIQPNVAAVTFTVTAGGDVVLGKAPGYAVKTGDTWQVAAQTFCGLLDLQHDAPDACDDPTVTALPN